MHRIIKGAWFSQSVDGAKGTLAMLSLNDLGVGETAVVCALDGGAHFRSRMASLGFTPGVSVKMMQNYGCGAVIVSLRGTRVALGQGEACKVGVTRPQG
jgi:Fe2+ transport system protein FeoA